MCVVSVCTGPDAGWGGGGGGGGPVGPLNFI